MEGEPQRRSLAAGIVRMARLIARARLHAAVDGTDAEAPGRQSVDEVVQRVFELSKEKQALVRVIEEALLLEQRLQFRELRLRARFLYRPRL